MQTDLTALKQANLLPSQTTATDAVRSNWAGASQVTSRNPELSFHTALKDLTGLNGRTAFSDQPSSYAPMNGEDAPTRRDEAQESTMDAQQLQHGNGVTGTDHEHKAEAKRKVAEGDIEVDANAQSDVARPQSVQDEVEEKDAHGRTREFAIDTQRGIHKSESIGGGKDRERRASLNSVEAQSNADAASRAANAQARYSTSERIDDPDAPRRRDHVRTQAAIENLQSTTDKTDSRQRKNTDLYDLDSGKMRTARSDRFAASSEQERSPQRAAGHQHVERSSRSVFGEHRPERVGAAAGRVAQVEAAMRLERASGQTQSSDAASRLANQVHQLNLASLQTGSVQQPSGNPALGHFTGAESTVQDGSATRAALDDARFSSRVIRGLTAMVNSRGGTMSMRLDPPDMGQLRIQMTLARGVVTAEFQAQNLQAQQLLEKNIGTLRAALESQGLTVERLNVNTQNGPQQNGTMHDEGSNRDQQANRHDAGSGQSRGRQEDASASDRQATGTTESEFEEFVEHFAKRDSSED